MGEYFKIIGLVITSCLFVYLLGAFVNSSFDTTLWEHKSRLIAVVFMIILSIFIVMIYCLNKILK